MTTDKTRHIDRDELRKLGVIIPLNGKEYCTHDGLLRIAAEHGLRSIETTIISYDPEAREAVIKAIVDGDRGRYVAHGDASPANVGRAIANATLRMAETRAVSRALRFFTGLGMTSSDELPGNAPSAERAEHQESRPPAKRDQPEQEGPPSILEQLRGVMRGQLGVTSKADGDILARWLRQVPDTNEPYWETFLELASDPEGPEWAMNAIGHHIVKMGGDPSDLLQAAIDAHGGKDD